MIRGFASSSPQFFLGRADMYILALLICVGIEFSVIVFQISRVAHRTCIFTALDLLRKCLCGPTLRATACERVRTFPCSCYTGLRRQDNGSD